MKWILASMVVFSLTGCTTLSDSIISESTAPANIGIEKSSSITGDFEIIVTSAEIRSTSQWDLHEAAITRAKRKCPEFAITYEKYRTGEEATSMMMGIKGPWLEIQVICANVDKKKLKGIAAVVVERESSTLADASFFDTHAETFSADFETVFVAVTRVLTSQGDNIYRSDKDRGIIITGRARHGVIGLPTYEQYVIVIDDESPKRTRVTFKLFVHSPNFAMGGVANMPPVDRKFAYRRAAAFVDRLKAVLN